MDSAFSLCKRVLRFCDSRRRRLLRLEDSLFGLVRNFDGGDEFDFLWGNVSVYATSPRSDLILQRKTAYLLGAHRY